MAISEITFFILRCQQNITTISEARGNEHSKLKADNWTRGRGEATYLGTVTPAAPGQRSPGCGESPRPALRTARRQHSPTSEHRTPAVLPTQPGWTKETDTERGTAVPPQTGRIWVCGAAPCRFPANSIQLRRFRTHRLHGGVDGVSV